MDLNLSLKMAGSSFGIATEFLYKIYNKPETSMVFIPAFVLDSGDLQKLDAVLKENKFALLLTKEYLFRPRLPPSFGDINAMVRT